MTLVRALLTPGERPKARPLTREDWTLIASVTGEPLRPFEDDSDLQGILAGP
jgi:hypothetical protein